MTKCILAALLCTAASAQRFTFQSPSSYAAQKAPLAMTTGDFNGDGKLDLATANAGSQTVSVFLGKGDGTFQAPASYALPSGCAANYLAAGDFNKDGHADLLATCFFGSVVAFLPGKGDGTLGAAVATQLPLPSFTGDIIEGGNIAPAIADFDADGNLDVVLSLAVLDNTGSLTTTTAYLLRGRGDGTFQAPETVGALASLQVLSFGAADFNGDGKPDLAALAFDNVNSSATVVIALGQGDGTFRLVNSYTTPVAFSITVGDINGDGKPDVLVSGAEIGSSLVGSIAVYTGNGDGSLKLANSHSYGSDSFVFSVCLADIQGSGKIDLVTAVSSGLANGFATATGSISILAGNGDGTFQNPVTLAPLGGTVPFFLVAGDFNADGRPDLAYPTLPAASLAALSATSGIGSPSDQIVAALGTLPNGNVGVMLNTTPPVTFSDANAASFQRGPMAQDSIIAAFGAGLASTTATPKTLTTSLGGVTVNVTDSAGATRAATLFYVSPTQVNYALPAGTATGNASITIANGASSVSAAQQIVPAVPGLFAVNGIAAANVATYTGSTLASFGNAFQVSANGAITPAPIDLGSGSQQVYLLLYGTGIRHATSVTANVGALTGLRVVYAGPQGFYVGEDQINLLLPQSLKGTGLIDLTLVADGQATNTVRLQIQ
jgi:uncharacterized protein (TIGR03437 family)